MMDDSVARKPLRRGQSLHLYAGTGRTIVAASGPAHLVYAPGLFGDDPIQEKVSLQDGEAHVVQRGSWLAISTPADEATICMVAKGRLGTTPGKKRMRLLVTLRNWFCGSSMRSGA